MNPPEGWTVENLSDILLPRHQRRVMKILLVQDKSARMHELKEYLNSIAPQLEARCKVSPDWLAYVLEWKRNELLRK